MRTVDRVLVVVTKLVLSKVTLHETGRFGSSQLLSSPIQQANSSPTHSNQLIVDSGHSEQGFAVA